FVGTVDPVARIGEPDAAIARDGNIVWRVQRFALEPVDQHGDRAVEFSACDTLRIMLAGNQPALVIAGIAVGVVRWAAEHRQVPVVFQPAHHAVVRNVAENQISAVAEINWPLRPTETGRDPFDAGIALLVSEAPIEHLDPWIGVTGIGQKTYWQRHGSSET